MEILGPYKVMGIAVPFWLYMLGLLGLSTISHMDIATSGIFTVRLVKTASCPGNLMQKAWEQTASASFFPNLPALDHFAIVLWLLMVVQLLHGFYYGFPKTCEQFKAFLFRPEPEFDSAQDAVDHLND